MCRNSKVEFALLRKYGVSTVNENMAQWIGLTIHTTVYSFVQGKRTDVSKMTQPEQRARAPATGYDRKMLILTRQLPKVQNKVKEKMR